MYLRSSRNSGADLDASEFEFTDMAWKQDTCRHCMYILLFACACGKRAGVTAPHYILHMFCLFCACVACAHYMLQECGLDPKKHYSIGDMMKVVSTDANGKERRLIDHCRDKIVRLYLHPHDARALHLSFSVNIAWW